MDQNIFREYDIRGIVGEQLTDDTVHVLAKAIGRFYGANNAKRIAVGYDARESSPRFCRILTEALIDRSIDVLQIGMVPTPVLYYTVFTKPVDGGVMITGSHNPADHNGFKVCLGKETLFGEQIKEIGRLTKSIEEEEKVRERQRSTEVRGQVGHLQVIDDYVADVVSGIQMGGRKLRAVVDAGNGVGGITAVPVFERLGVDLMKLYTEPDSAFPNHHADPTVTENLFDCVEAVTAYEADIGIAFDGDGDRIGVVDETGRIIWGDELMVLLSRSILAGHPGSTIIAEVKCSQTLFDDIERHGGQPLMWKAGHSLIKAKMKETGAALAGEMSGHIFFADRFYGFDDAAYAGARVLEILSNTEKGLSELLSDLPKTYSTPELRVPCREEIKLKVVDGIADHFSKTNEVIMIDGARIVFEHGWGLVRPSNTQAILVLRFEADTEQHLDEIRGQVEEKVKEMIG